MRQSKLFTKILKEFPKDEESVNARFLIRAGFIDKLMAGVYTFLPLGLRVLNKIENIAREEMNEIGGKEILMPALHPKENWEKTGRFNSFDALFKLKSKYGGEMALGPTHEEILYPILIQYVSSYRDLPLYIYQIQTKFRDEPRAKSGLLRGREFRMKDFYSFHADDADRDRYYDAVKEAYLKIFQRLEIDVLMTRASGGTFSELSLEFQALCSAGEDVVFICDKCGLAVNKELAAGEEIICHQCGGKTEEKRAIEAGNIFPLKDKYAKDFNLVFKDKAGESKLVSVGCYGLGTSRAMGTITELHHDKKGIIWPESVAPFDIHLLELMSSDPEINKNIKKISREIYDTLSVDGESIRGGQNKRKDVLCDERESVSIGEKFAEADLIGIPLRIVVSEKTLAKESVEIKRRDSNEIELIKIKDLRSFYKIF